MGQVSIGSGDIQMDTDATDAAMNALGSAGSDLTRDWGTLLTAINGLEGQIGQGPLGRPFAHNYNAEAEPVVEATELMFGAPERTAASGRTVVASYLLVEAEITAAYEV